MKCCLFLKINIEIRNLITENVALNKPAWQQHPLFIYDAGLAVDGHKTDLYGWQCMVSQQGYSTVEWRVDLERVLSIHHIFILYRTDNHVWGMALKILQIYKYTSNQL